MTQWPNKWISQWITQWLKQILLLLCFLLYETNSAILLDPETYGHCTVQGRKRNKRKWKKTHSAIRPALRAGQHRWLASLESRNLVMVSPRIPDISALFGPKFLWGKSITATSYFNASTGTWRSDIIHGHICQDGNQMCQVCEHSNIIFK